MEIIDVGETGRKKKKQREAARSRGRKRRQDGTRVTSQAVCLLSLKGKELASRARESETPLFALYSLCALTRGCV